jgi:hypothetical protein
MRIRLAGKDPLIVDAARTYFETLPRFVELGSPRPDDKMSPMEWNRRCRTNLDSRHCAKIVAADYDRNDCSITVELEPYGPLSDVIVDTVVADCALSARIIRRLKGGKVEFVDLICFDLIAKERHADYQTEEPPECAC